MAEEIFEIGDDRNNLKLVKIDGGDTIANMVNKINANFENIASHGGGPTGADGVKGDKGVAGPQGPRGPQGPQGPAGANGSNGRDGRNGKDGSGYSIILSNPVASIPCGEDMVAGDEGSDVQNAMTGVNLYLNSEIVDSSNIKIILDNDVPKCVSVDGNTISFKPTPTNTYEFVDGKLCSVGFTVKYGDVQIKGTWNLIPIPGLIKYELYLSTNVVRLKLWNTSNTYSYIPSAFTASPTMLGSAPYTDLKTYYRVFNEGEIPSYSLSSEWTEFDGSKSTRFEDLEISDTKPIVGIILVKDEVVLDYGSINAIFDGKDGEKGEDGKDGGPAGPSYVFRGPFKSGEKYYATKERRDIVWYTHEGDTKYAYVTTGDGDLDSAGTFTPDEGETPNTDNRWKEFQENFDMVATEVLLAEDANIAGFIFHENKLVSQEPDPATPSISIDGVTGEIRAGGDKVVLNGSGITVDGGSFTIKGSGGSSSNIESYIKGLIPEFDDSDDSDDTGGSWLESSFDNTIIDGGIVLTGNVFAADNYGTITAGIVGGNVTLSEHSIRPIISFDENGVSFTVKNINQEKISTGKIYIDNTQEYMIINGLSRIPSLDPGTYSCRIECYEYDVYECIINKTPEGGYATSNDNGVKFFAGSNDMDHAPFRVYGDGRLVATNAEISGNITTNSLLAETNTKKTVINGDEFKVESNDSGASISITIIDSISDISGSTDDEVPEGIQNTTNIPTLCMTIGDEKYYLWPGAWRTKSSSIDWNDKIYFKPSTNRINLRESRLLSNDQMGPSVQIGSLFASKINSSSISNEDVIYRYFIYGNTEGMLNSSLVKKTDGFFNDLATGWTNNSSSQQTNSNYVNYGNYNYVNGYEKVYTIEDFNDHTEAPSNVFNLFESFPDSGWVLPNDTCSSLTVGGLYENYIQDADGDDSSIINDINSNEIHGYNGYVMEPQRAIYAGFCTSDTNSQTQGYVIKNYSYGTGSISQGYVNPYEIEQSIIAEPEPLSPKATIKNFIRGGKNKGYSAYPNQELACIHYPIYKVEYGNKLNTVDKYLYILLSTYDEDPPTTGTTYGWTSMGSGNYGYERLYTLSYYIDNPVEDMDDGARILAELIERLDDYQYSVSEKLKLSFTSQPSTSNFFRVFNQVTQ